uniref:MFS transporter n=1 Tax=candidate division WOR-3 bacterium TaxID=2052148 RepID=A0A7C4CBP9_UNCW3
MNNKVVTAPAAAKAFNRWWIVVGALLVQICLGAIYAWSVFRKPLEAQLGITPTQASLPFSVVLIFFALATVLGGRLQDRFGPRIVAILGGVLLALGMIVASLARNISVLVIAYGVISGIGIGFAYVCPISAGVKWFPDKRGLITGLAVAGFGAGAFFVAPLAAGLISGTPYNLMGANLFNLPELGIFNTFRVLGIAYLVVVTVGGFILRNPPSGFVPKGWTPPTPAGGRPAATNYTFGQMLGTGQFWVIWLMYFAGCAAGLMMIGQTSPIAQELAGFDKSLAAVGVSVLAIFNTLGRIFWGRISDSIGRSKTLFLMYLINAIAVFGYFLIPATPFLFWVGIALVGATFGGYLATYPAITADYYGTKSVGLNYGFVFTAYGVGGLLANIFAPRVREITGNYNLAFILTAVLCLAAALVSLLIRPPAARQQPA